MKNSYADTNLPVFFAISCFIHVIIFYIAFFGITLRPRILPQEQVMTFELLPVSSINNVKTQKVQKEPAIKNDDAKKVEKSKIAESTEKQDKLEEKKIEEPKKEAPKEEKKEMEALPSNEKKVEEKKPEDNKKEEVKKEELKKKEAKKEDKKPTPKKKLPNDKELDSLLKNLEKSSDGKNNKSRKINRENSKAESDAFGNFDDTSPQSLTNDELIKQQIMKHWNQPVASATENIIIAVELHLAESGTVEKTDIVSAICPAGKDLLCSSTKDSVIRAITNASPLVNLLPEDYNSWKKIIVTFNTTR